MRGLLAVVFIFGSMTGAEPVVLAQAPAATATATAATAAMLSGQVQDKTGAMIPNARVELQRTNGALVATVQTDAAGQFRIPLPAATGDLRITVALPGFEPMIKPLRIGRTAPAPLTLVLSPASVATSVDVNAADVTDPGSPDSNMDAASVSADDMKSLPVLDSDIVTALSAFLDTGAAGEGGASLIVDGVEMKTAGVAPSAIERVSINENPYSAQYKFPGRGQIEIVTKNTADKFHGSVNFSLRDHIFDARNYFATSKPPDQRLAWEGYLTGPIKPLANTTFLFSLLQQNQSIYEQINATTAPGVTTTGNVLSPYRNTNLTMKVAHQITDKHSDYLLYRFFDRSRANQAVGGQVLPSAGYTSYTFDMDLTFHDDDALSDNKFNQFSVLFERNIDRVVSSTQAPQIIVEGAFIGGSAQADSLQTENNPNISDIFSWTTHKTHQLKFGVQLPNLGRRILEDNTDRLGTYTFGSVPNCTPVSSTDTHCSALANYAGGTGTPQSFTIQQGQSRFLTYYCQPGAFILDQIQVTPQLTVTPGIRYDFQNQLPNTKDAFQPRLAVAYVIDKKHAMVLRFGDGVYMRRIGVDNGQRLAKYQNAAEQSYLLTTGICFNATKQCNTLTAQPPNLFNYAPGIKAPFQNYFGVSLEREITKKSTLTIGYEGYRGWHALRAPDVNAPLPPFTSSVRPNPNYGQIAQMQSGGYQKTDSLVVSYRGRIGKVYSGFAQYTYSHADANTLWSEYMPENSYDPNADWSRADYDQRHRLNLFGTLYPDKALNFGFGFYNYTPTPYSELTGTDDYHTGVFNARPAGVPRNTLNGGLYQDLQVRVTYTHKLQPKLKDASPAVAFYVSSFNTLNRVNFQGYDGVVTSSEYRQPTSAADPRRLQLGVSYNF